MYQLCLITGQSDGAQFDYSSECDLYILVCLKEKQKVKLLELGNERMQTKDRWRQQG